MSTETLSVTDNRTGRTYELPIANETVRAMDLRQIKVNESDFGLMSYDPAFKNTASTKSTITDVKGAKGILRYRGYPIEQLAEQSSFLEVAYLILNGELPSQDELAAWESDVKQHTMVYENLGRLISSFRYDARPMSMMMSGVAALGTYYVEDLQPEDSGWRQLQATRLIAKMPTLAAMAYRHISGLPFNYPDKRLSYAGNMLQMMFRMTEPTYALDPALERALDLLFILHADHEQNCGTHTMRSAGSSRVDPYSAATAAIAALYGPLHGGANEAVIRMLMEIGDVSNVSAFIERVKSDRSVRLMGFGHRVYKNYDPRATIVKKAADKVFAVTGYSPLLDIALELERIALEDDYFIGRKLYPNVDFYSGLIYQAMGLPPTMYTVMFAVPRAAGWLAQWQEMVQDPEQAIARPRQVYLGSGERDYVAITQR